MSGVTLQLIVEGNPDRVATAADAWLRMSDGLDNACEEFIRGSRDLEHVWPDGPAAQAAGQKGVDLRAEAGNAFPPCRRIGDALRYHADTLRSLKHTVESIAAEARGKGYLVDLAAGTVCAGSALANDSSQGRYLAQVITSYVHQFQDILDQAAALDQQTLNVLNANTNLPNAETGFGSMPGRPIRDVDLQEQQGKSAADRNAWWKGLTSEQQEQAIRDYPQIIGWMDGLPATDRDTANRLSLAQQHAVLQARKDALIEQMRHLDPRSGGASRLLEQLWETDKQLDGVTAVEKNLTKLGSRGLLLGIDTAADGKAIIAVGNPDTARHTAVWVPGLGTTLAGSTDDNVERMIHLNDAADRITSDATNDVSTVMWLGYDAPELDSSVVTSERSKAGAEPYVSFMQGMHAAHEGDPGHLIAMGHSYGSTVVGEAAATGRLKVDDIAVVGSPGMHTARAENLHIDPHHVWAGSSATDPVSATKGVSTILGIVGGPAGAVVGGLYGDGHDVSPHYEEFGGNRFTADTWFHSSYWNEGSDSLNNQAAVVAGDYGRVKMEHGKKPENWHATP